jgi:hypothetical protein
MPELIGKLKPKNNGNFALVEARDIVVDDNDKRLDEVLKELANNGGGSGGTTDYDELNDIPIYNSFDGSIANIGGGAFKNLEVGDCKRLFINTSSKW